MPTATISVSEVQQGLTYWRNVESRGLTDDAPSPGRIDGMWGPRTHEALRAYVAHHAGGSRFDAARVLAPLRSVPARTREIELELYFAGRLQTHAVLYRSRPRGGSGSRPSTPRDEPGRVRPPPDRGAGSGADSGGGSVGAGGDRGDSRESSSEGSPAFAILGLLLVAAGGTAAAVAWSRRKKKSDPYDDEGLYDDDALLETDWA